MAQKDHRETEQESALAHVLARTTRFEKGVMVASIALCAAFVALDASLRWGIVGSDLPRWLKAILLAG